MELVTVYQAEGQLEAEMIKSFLEAQGIDVVINQESIGRTYGLSVGTLGMVEVLVPKSQAEDAEQLLKAMENGEFENIDFSDTSEENPPEESDE